MYNRLTNDHGLNNLIWVWSTPSAAWYPGNSKVDIFGFDSYPGAYNYGSQKSVFDQMFATCEGKKMIAMTENGPMPDPSVCTEEDAIWSYFSSWVDLVAKQNSTQHIVNVYAHKNVITLDEVTSVVTTLEITPYTQLNGGTWNQTNVATLCAGETVSFGPHPNLDAGWTWTGPNNFTATTRQITFTNITANKAGNYIATYKDVNGNTGTKTFTITVNALPTATISTTTPTTFCQGGSVVFTASAGTSYKWYNGTTALTTTTATHTANANGSYTVEVTNANGCKATSAAKVVTVNALPTVTVTPSTATICAGGNVSLTAAGATTYAWSPATGLSATTGAAVTATPITTTTYTVTGTTNGCTGTATKLVTVNALPTVSAQSNTPCVGSDLQLQASGGISYAWNKGSVWTSSQQNPVRANVSSGIAGTYRVVVTDANNCINEKSISVIVNALPTVSISSSSDTICSGSSATLTAKGANTYAWNTGETNADLTISPLSTTTYTVTGTDAKKCSNTKQYTIAVEICTGINTIDPNSEKEGISVYPNPASSVLNIQIQNSANLETIYLLNTIGEIVVTHKVKSTNEVIDIQNLSSGMYLLKVGNAIHKVAITK